MDERDKHKSFETILKAYSEKKPLSLYNGNVKGSTSLPLEDLKPQDIIASVSKQLRDIQKADSWNKESEKVNIKANQCDFISIKDLCSQEDFQHHHATKFETQSVTDTQLIDIVDNVEATVNVNIDLPQDSKEPFWFNQDYLKKKNNIASLSGVNFDDYNKDFKYVQFANEKKEICIDDINTDICNEFDTSYSETHSVHNTHSKSHLENILNNTEGPMYKENIVNSENDSNFSNTNIVAETINRVKGKNDNSHIDIESIETGSDLENIFLSNAHSNSNNGVSILLENQDPKCPVSKTFKSMLKSKALSPLIYPLDSFEKFESLAMPLIEKNIDLVAVKHLINSQIINNQLLNPANPIPILQKITYNTCNILNKELLIHDSNHIETLIESKQILNNSTSYADEILFSSDEENEYFHYCSKKLPMTCPLKTSFYESKIDLDETVFVGFQTSSNKCIQVSKDSLFKAKNMLADTDKQKNVNRTLTELVDIYDSNVFAFNNNLPSIQASVEDSNTNNGNVNDLKSQILKTSAIEHEIFKVLEETKLIKYDTVNNISLHISETLKCKTDSKDIVGDMVNSVDDVPISHAECKNAGFMGLNLLKRKNITKESSKYSTDDLNHIDSNLNHSCVDIDLEAKNFDRAKTQHQITQEGAYLLPKNNNLKVNYNIMNVVDQTLLQEFENELSGEFIPENNQRNCNALQIVDNLKMGTKKFHVGNSEPNEAFDPGIPEFPQPQSSLIFSGFKTANNKYIKISTEALAKTKDLFHDIGSEDFDQNENNSENKLRFNYRDENVARSANIIKSDSDVWSSKPTFFQVGSSDQQAAFQGFKTASNKNVKISKEALLKTEKIFQDINEMCINRDRKSTKIEGGSNGDMKYMTNDKDIHGAVSIQGVKVTNDTVKQNIDHTDSVKIMYSDMYINNITNSINFNTVNNEITSNVERAEENVNVNAGSVFQGFKTANNKLVIVSKESLLKTKNIFQDIDNKKNDSFEITKCVIDNFKISTGRLDKNEVINKIVTTKTSAFQGFKTARNKQVVISEDAVTKAKCLFEEVHFESKVSRNKDEHGKANQFATDIKNVSQVISVKRNNTDIGAFKGFQTASNRSVKISDEAITRTRQIFDEIYFDVPCNRGKFESEICSFNGEINKENIENECENGKVPLVYERKTAISTANNNSKRSLKESGQVFSGLDKNINKNFDELVSHKFANIDTKNNLNIDNIINTQLLNNFEENLQKEEFCKDSTPKQCKRSGSPILSCPKAKKRKKFETPYRSDTPTANIQEQVHRTNNISNVKYTFSKNYKTTKLYSLKELDRIDKNKSSALIDPYILNFDFETLLEFEFEGSRNEITGVKWTTNDIKTCFIESVDNKIIPEGWLNNHIKLIMWKLISYEIRFPNILQVVCSARNVLEQLKYRYDKELYRVQRPALRKLIEKDDISTRTMVLAVVGVHVDGVKVQSVSNPSAAVELLLTDGWYCVTACTDKMISRLVSNGKIAVGTKIATVGAELLNCEQGVSPWEDTSSVRLKIFGNCTRPARWDARLGYTKGTVLSKLSTIDPSGGKVSSTRVMVVRVYPMLYVEKLEDGSTVTRSERLEHIHQIKYETDRQNQLEELYEEVQKKFYDQESPESEGIEMDYKKNEQSGSQLSRLMKKSNDPSQFRSHLTDSQALLLRGYTSKKQEKIVEELQKRIQEKMRAQGLHIGRNVIPLFKIRVASFEEAGIVKICKAMISIWRPNDAILDVVKEGVWIDLFNVVPTAVRNSEIQMSAGRQSVFHRSKHKEKDKMKPYIESLRRKCYTTNELNKNATMHTNFEEIDTVGVVFLIEPSLNDYDTTKGQQFQNVYLTDVDKNFICINFWGGIKKFGYENIFDTGNVVACINLQKRAGNTRKCIPQYRATEITVFTKTPKLDHVKNVTEELIKAFSGLDKRKFCNDCIIIKHNYTSFKQNYEFSPYRFNTSDNSLTRNKIFIDSPLAQNKDVNLNLTGLDFDSTFQQFDTQALSPTALKRKQLVKEKIAKLKMYGEPPPLTKIHIKNQSRNASSAYKSPLTSGILNVTGMKNMNDSPATTNKLIQSSPILSSCRTRRAGVNPVKLNFSATSAVDDKVECNPFEEEFEASLPLSLD